MGGVHGACGDGLRVSGALVHMGHLAMDLRFVRAVWSTSASSLQLLVFVASVHTAACSQCTELASLGYISDKPIVIAAASSKQELLTKLPFGM